MTAILRKSNSKHWRVPEDLAIDLRASALADRVAGVVLKMHRSAIVAGVRVSDDASQPPLDPKGQQGRQAAKGRRPPHRGNTGKTNGFPRALRRGKTTRARGETNASVVIEAPGKFTGWLEREDRFRDVEYLSTDGLVAEAIEAEVFAWLDEITRPGKKQR